MHFRENSELLRGKGHSIASGGRPPCEPYPYVSHTWERAGGAPRGALKPGDREGYLRVKNGWHLIPPARPRRLSSLGNICEHTYVCSLATHRLVARSLQATSQGHTRQEALLARAAQRR